MSSPLNIAIPEWALIAGRRPPEICHPSLATVRSGNAVWEIDPTIVDDFLTVDGPRWLEWRESGALEIVKHGPHRTVYRLDLPAGGFYLKHFRVADWKARLRNLLVPCQAEREWFAAQQFTQLGLPTFEALGLGRTRQWGTTGESFLISRAIPDAVPLDQFLRVEYAALSPRRQAAMRQLLAVELGRLACRLRVNGIRHPDFHAGNILIEPKSDRVQLWLIDLHAVRFANRPIAAHDDSNLDALAPFFASLATRSDRLRFFRAQKDSDVAPPTGTSEIPITLLVRQEARWRSSALAGWDRADRAWRRGNRHVRKLDSWNIRCRALARLGDEWVQSLRDDPELVYQEHLLRWCKQSRRHRVAEVLLPSPGNPVRAYWKCVERRGGLLRRALRLRDTAVRRAWETGHALLRRGIDTPTPLMYVEWRETFCDRWYLLTAAVPHTLTLTEFLKNPFRRLSTAERHAWLVRLVSRLAAQVHLLHESRFDHRDLKFDNLLVSAERSDSRCWMLDLESVRRWARLPRARAVQNLVRINVSSLCHPGIGAAHRLRFLKQYLGSLFDREWKWWWRVIAQKSIQKQQQNHHRGRPLT